ncbi:MAG: flagellar biosynthesis anti-sigma factor FlgM, partial [Rhodobiaceae bacterium]
MVDAIKNSVNRMELTKGRAADGRPAGAGASPASVAPAGDTVKVSNAASSKAVAQLAEAPPVNTEAVRRIKDAISRGEYP